MGLSAASAQAIRPGADYFVSQGKTYLVGDKIILGAFPGMVDNHAVSGAEYAGESPATGEGFFGTKKRDCMKPADLRIYLKFKNARLLNAISEHFGEEVSLRIVANKLDVSVTHICNLINLKFSPFAARKSKNTYEIEGFMFTQSAMKIADYFKISPTDLFPYSLYQLRFPKYIYREIDSVKLLSLQEAREQKLLPDQIYIENFDKGDLKDQINNLLQILTKREEKLIKMRFGLDGEEEKTLDEIALEWHISRERIRQLEKKALRKLRLSPIDERLKPFWQEH